MAEIDSMLRSMVDKGGSDLHLMVGQLPKARISGSIQPISEKVLDAAALERLLKEIVPERKWNEYLERKDLDLAHEIAGFARFRAATSCSNHWGQAAVFRQIPAKHPLVRRAQSCPEAIKKLCHLNEGLVGDHRAHGQRQVNDARGDDRLHQHEPPAVAHHHDRGPDRSSCTR